LNYNLKLNLYLLTYRRRRATYLIIKNFQRPR